MEKDVEIDRLSILEPPDGNPLGFQTWDKLLFMHWPMPQELLLPLIPDGISIDTFDDRAWIGVAPFVIPGMRPALLSLPFEPGSLELNVRTYVHMGGVPGVWFFSLDASSVMAVIAARVGFALPYFHARMEMEVHDRETRFESRRFHPGAAAARFEAQWTHGDALPNAEPGSLEFFLIERYCLYVRRRGGIYRARIHHPPWPLQKVELRSFSSSMIESHGLPTPGGDPLLHGQSAPLEVGIWPLKKVADDV